MGLVRQDAVPVNAPQQYSSEDRCRECGTPLSIYNPNEVCGVCYRRLGLHLTDPETHTHRPPVRRGALLPDTA
jgi:ribosomal protein S14